MRYPSIVPIFNIFLVALLCGAQAVAQSCPPGNPRSNPDGRYVDHGDGTVTDRNNGLMWKRCSEGQSGSGCIGTTYVQNWSTALAVAGSSSFGGYNDWRLPDTKELQSLIETGCFQPAINSTHFPNTPNLLYWASTTVARNSSNALLVSFSDGFVFSYVGKSSVGAVRLVRAGI